MQNDASAKAELIFMQWKTELANKDKSYPKIEGNFYELFSALKDIDTPVEVVLSILPKAIKAHQPSSIVQRRTWDVLQSSGSKKKRGKFEDFREKWMESIENKGNSAFFQCYPQMDPINAEDDEDIPTARAFGNMSEREYRLQRQYAESFPVLDTSELEKQLFSSNLLDAELDNFFGGNDETK